MSNKHNLKTQFNKPLKTYYEDNEKPIPRYSLLDFIRLYKIGGIPIIDFFIVYIILYMINKIHFNYDFKLVLVATIPVTIVFNLVINKKIKITLIIIIILLLSMLYLIYLYRKSP